MKSTGSDQPMDLSVVIVSYNVRHFLEQCLKSVIRASENISCEIIVVDNNSADGSCSMLSRTFHGIKLIRNNCNAGFSAACNQGIRSSNGEYVLLLNPDTVVEEGTFRKCISFMKEHPDAGALGVKMLNGRGKLLPESKRAVPTPTAAFFKVTGLSRMLPNSSFFNRYYLGHIDSSATSEAEIISGAFMFIRKTALDRTGLLDESYFMYGEDIDLSYRLLKAGFINYYFPEVKIIHYKGESTGEGEFNTTLHFYRAMLIFIQKHFSGKQYRPFLFLIKLAVYTLGSFAVLKNIIARYIFPAADTLFIFIIFNLMIIFWGKYRFGSSYRYPETFKYMLIPLFIAVSLISVMIAGGYKRPSRPLKVMKGLLASSATVLVVYSLLPLGFRFSRAVVVLGSISSAIILPSYRIILAAMGIKSVINPFARAVRTAFVGSEENYNKLCGLMATSGKKQVFAGRVSIRTDDLGKDVLGSVGQIEDIVKINRITRIVFSAGEMTATQLIDAMQVVSKCNIDIRISPEGENLLIGSKSVGTTDEF